MYFPLMMMLNVSTNYRYKKTFLREVKKTEFTINKSLPMFVSLF